MDQDAGNSTSFCSKIVSPVFQFVWTTSRRSQVISSYGWTPGVVKTRLIVRPFFRNLGVSRESDLPVLCDVSVMRSPSAWSVAATRAPAGVRYCWSVGRTASCWSCLLYTSDAADDL